MKWVTLKKYCDMSGETEMTVKKRRQKGVWADGKQCKIGPNGKIWVNPQEVDKWVENYHAA